MRILFLLFLIGNMSFAQVNESGFFKKSLHKDSVKRDLRILRELLDKFHPGEFQHTSRLNFDQTFDSLYQQIETYISEYEFFKMGQVLLAKVKDGHTFADNSQVIEVMKKRSVLPFNVFIADSSYYVYKAVNDGSQNLIGKKVISINGMPMHTIIRKAKNYMSIEGENESGFQRKYQIFPFYYFLIDTASSFLVTYYDSIGKVYSETVAGCSYKDFLKKTRVIVEPISFAIDENKIGVLHLNTFAISDFESRKLNYEKSIDEIFKTLHDQKITRLIIDVRGNGGGSPEVSNYLFSWLKKGDSYFYFEQVCRKYSVAGDLRKYCVSPQNIQDTDTSITTNKNGMHCEIYKGKGDYWWFRPQKPKKHPFQGNLVTLIDGGSFSTTGHFLALLRNYNIGISIGEYSQGSYYSNDGAQYFVLPYSKLGVRIPTAQFRIAAESFKYDPKGISPDREIHRSRYDFVGGIDKAMLEARVYLNSLK